jgi:Fe2+ transport system protein FeoA
MASLTLSQLKPGARARITHLDSNSSLSDRLSAMGFHVGGSVSVLHSALMNDPRTYQVCGSQVSLRKSEADLVEVSF